MKFYLMACMALFSIKMWAGDPVTNNLSVAKEKAKTEHKLILLKFSGSDWCIPCINIQKKVIDTPEFQNFAKSNLVLMNADFPRLKKNLPSESDKKLNAALAEKYDKEGIFPKMLLLDENGKILAHWEGLEKMEPKVLESKIMPYLGKK